MHAIRNLFVLTAIVILVGGGAFFALKNVAKSGQKVANVPSKEVEKVQAQEVEKSASSIDGTKVLTLKTTEISDSDSKNYSFYASNAGMVYSKILDDGSSLDIPANAWAPGEKYIFIEENINGVRDDLVLNADGLPFADGQQAIDVGSLYASRSFPYKYEGATGWADPSLLIVTTTKEDGSKGPKYWFEVPSRGFIQLAR